MAILHANAMLVKDLRVDVDDGRNHAICLDLQPKDGTDLGPSALELALMSYVGCYVTIFALTARKMRIKISSLEAKAEAIKNDEAGTITETNFDISVKAEAKQDRIQRIHELTLKNCPVGRLFDKAGVTIRSNLKTE